LVQINKLVGEQGSHDKNRLSSCLSSLDYYDSPLDKLCAAARSVAQDHPFLDGNKRVAASLLVFGGCRLTDREMIVGYDDIVNAIVSSVIDHWSPTQYRDWFLKSSR
jgi:prophage maintenance system killer protein